MSDHLSNVIGHHDKWAETYDSDILGSMGLYNRVTLDNIKRYLPEDKNAVILDAGGGTGIWAVQVAQMGYKVVLTDVSTGMLEKAREKIAGMGLHSQVEIRVSDIRNMPEFEDGQFGMVICEGDPLSYCGDHRAAVGEFARVLRKGGTIVASVDSRASGLNWLRDTPDRDTILRLLDKGEILVPNWQGEFPYVIHAFTPAELHELFESNGFLVERIIGKPVVANRLAMRESTDPAVHEWLYQLEIRYCDDPAFCALGGHLEIACKKR